MAESATTPVLNPLWWHVYRGEMTGFPGAVATVTCEESPKHPREMPEDLEGMAYVTSFDHEPTDHEMGQATAHFTSSKGDSGE